MSGRQFWCGACWRWLPVVHPEGARMSRAMHERRHHTPEAEFFTRPDLLELDAFLDRLYS